MLIEMDNRHLSKWICENEKKVYSNKDKDSWLCEGVQVPTPPQKKTEIILYEEARLASTRSGRSSSLYTPGAEAYERFIMIICVLIPHTSVYVYPEVRGRKPAESLCLTLQAPCAITAEGWQTEGSHQTSDRSTNSSPC